MESNHKEVPTTVPPRVATRTSDPINSTLPTVRTRRLNLNITGNNSHANASNDSAHVAPTGELVALAPGVYTPFNPNVPDPTFYLDRPNLGGCAMRELHFSNRGGACWGGVS